MDTRTSVVAEAADTLALAMIASSNAPVLLLDDELTSSRPATRSATRSRSIRR